MYKNSIKQHCFMEDFSAWVYSNIKRLREEYTSYLERKKEKGGIVREWEMWLHGKWNQEHPENIPEYLRKALLKEYKED